MRAVELSIGAFCTEFRCEQLCDDDFFLIGVTFRNFHEKGRRESCEPLDLTILHKIRCEQLCDDDIFSIGVEFGICHEKGRRESCGALDRCILHRISVLTTL